MWEYLIATVLSVGSNFSPLSNCSDRKSGNHIRGYSIRVGNFQFGNRERFLIEHFKNHFISLHRKNQKMKIKFILRETNKNVMIRLNIMVSELSSWTIFFCSATKYIRNSTSKLSHGWFKEAENRAMCI